MEHFAPKKILHTTYVISVLFSMHVALLAFISSSFLEKFLSIKSVGLVFTISSLATICMMVLLPRLLRKFGNFRVTSFSIAAVIFCLIALSTLNEAVPIVFFFILHSALVGSIVLNFDIYVEEFSPHDSVGSIRGLFLTLTNAAWVIAQLTIAVLLTDSEYWRIYFLASFFALGAFIWAYRLEHVPDIHYKTIEWKTAIKSAWTRWNVRHIMLANLLLQFFFGWMTIYTPIYLHSHIGLSWSELGIVFTIMLLPYVFFELPLGKLADTRFGEKEILMAGFGVMAVSTIILSIFTTKSMIPWIVILFLTRVGSSATEIMIETYFFKKIKAEDDTLLEIFRMIRPVGYLIAPIVASFFLLFVSERLLFIPLGLIMLSGIYVVSKIVDTK